MGREVGASIGRTARSGLDATAAALTAAAKEFFFDAGHSTAVSSVIFWAVLALLALNQAKPARLRGPFSTSSGGAAPTGERFVVFERSGRFVGSGGMVFFLG
jgi:hypothetical protein